MSADAAGYVCKDLRLVYAYYWRALGSFWLSVFMACFLVGVHCHRCSALIHKSKFLRSVLIFCWLRDFLTQ